MKPFRSDKPARRFNKVKPSKDFTYDRAKRPFSRDRTEQFDAVCAKCGKDCQLPFKPRDPKSVYCRDCFTKNDSRSSDSRPGRPDFRRDRTESRPERSEFRSERPETRSSENEIQQINRKLDKIMKALKIE